MQEGVYSVQIRHSRQKPVAHRFAVSGYALFVNLRRFDDKLNSIALLGFDKIRPFNFRRRDFSLIASRSTTARDLAIDYLREKISIEADEVYLLATPAVFGYAFNPAAFYFFYKHGAHVATILAVTNTYREQKYYCFDALAGANRARKNFYVSPFVSPLADFDCRIHAPQESLFISISARRDATIDLVASVVGQRHSLNNLNLAKVFLLFPAYSLRVMAQIHWYALVLFLRRVPFYSKVAADAAAIYSKLRSAP